MTVKRCSKSLRLSFAPIGAVACGATRRADTSVARADWSCATARTEARKRLSQLDSGDAERRASRLATHSAVMDAMLRAGDAEARTMSPTLADDWKIQSFFVRNDLDRLDRMSPAAIVEFFALAS